METRLFIYPNKLTTAVSEWVFISPIWNCFNTWLYIYIYTVNKNKLVESGMVHCCVVYFVGSRSDCIALMYFLIFYFFSNHHNKCHPKWTKWFPVYNLMLVLKYETKHTVFFKTRRHLSRLAWPTQPDGLPCLSSPQLTLRCAAWPGKTNPDPCSRSVATSGCSLR